MAEKKSNIVGFKKFSEIKGKSKIEEVNPSMGITPQTDADLPANPNLPKESDSVERIASRKNIIHQDQNLEVDEYSDNFDNDIDMDENTHESKVDFNGKVAKFPKNTKASKAYNFLENVKVSKKSIWYIMVEQQSEELQLIKYNYKEGVDLNKFVNELKSYYVDKHKDNKNICELVSKIDIDGNDKYSKITNIPKIKIDDRLMITKITEDLIKLLSK
jgi:hypothetical protein